MVSTFVEADWWQDNRASTININGTRIDTDCCVVCSPSTSARTAIRPPA
jgi:hypothetical protein